MDLNPIPRRDKINYYLDIAETVLERGTCLRRNFGAIIVKNDEIVSTGYVGAPRGRLNCCDLGYCTREKLNIPKGQRYELCRSVHAEANAIISAARSDTIDATINAGISTVIIRNTHDKYTTINVQSWIEHDDSLEGTDGY